MTGRITLRCCCTSRRVATAAVSACPAIYELLLAVLVTPLYCHADRTTCLPVVCSVGGKKKRGKKKGSPQNLLCPCFCPWMREAKEKKTHSHHVSLSSPSPFRL